MVQGKVTPAPAQHDLAAKFRDRNPFLTPAANRHADASQQTELEEDLQRLVESRRDDKLMHVIHVKLDIEAMRQWLFGQAEIARQFVIARNISRLLPALHNGLHCPLVPGELIRPNWWIGATSHHRIQVGRNHLVIERDSDDEHICIA